MKLKTSIRTSIRRACGETQKNIRIDVVPASSAAPRSEGNSWYYETAGGRRIWHPSAYRAKGWRNMRYIASTRRVVVGDQWIASIS